MKYVDEGKKIDDTITDSKEIMYYLAKAHPESELLPSDEVVQN